MAVYPCDYSRHRYRAPQQSIYYTEARAAQVDTYKMRLCPEHFDVVTAFLCDYLDDVEDEVTMSYICERCQGVRELTISARIYRNHSEEEQRVLDVCNGCAREIGNQAHAFNGEHLAGR